MTSREKLKYWKRTAIVFILIFVADNVGDMLERKTRALKAEKAHCVQYHEGMSGQEFMIWYYQEGC